MKFQTSNRPWWEQLSRSARAFPADLVVVVGSLVLINVIFRVPALRGATIAGADVQTLIGVPSLLVLPGYVLVSAVYPARAVPECERDTSEGRSIDPVERVALSFGMSVALLPLFAIVVGTGWGFSLPVVLTGFTALVAVGVVIAAVRRLRLPPHARHTIPVRRWLLDLKRGIGNPDSITDGIASLVLALAVLVAVGAVGFAVATPYESGPSSTFYIATQNETGVVQTADYPTSFTAGESQPLVAGIENDEERRQQYTVVIAVERVEDGPDGTTIAESAELGRLYADVADGAEWTERHTVAPEMIGEDLRLHYYLYKGESAPENPDPASAYRDTYIWIDVNEA